MYSSRMYWGTWVVLPQPVAPRMTTTELWWMASRISLSKFFRGKASLSSWIWKKSPGHFQNLQKSACSAPHLHFASLYAFPLPKGKTAKEQVIVCIFSWHSTTHPHIQPGGTSSTSENLVCICTEIQPYTLRVTFNPFWKIKSLAQGWQVTGSTLTLCNSWSRSRRYMKSLFRSTLICSGVSWKCKTLLRGFLTPLLIYIITSVSDQSHQHHDPKYP